MKKKEVVTDLAPLPVGPYSQAVRWGEWLWLSGQIPMDSGGNVVTGDIQVQTRQVLENIKQVLRASGLGFGNVVKTTVFLTNMEDFKKMNQMYRQYFKPPFPARSCVAARALPKAVNVEIELVAHDVKRFVDSGAKSTQIKTRG